MYQSISHRGKVGSAYLYLPSAESTNSYCRALLSTTNPPPEGLVVHTGNQYAGRGQMGNEWLVQPGLNLTFSCILYPYFLAPVEQFYLTMAVSLSVLDLLDSYADGALLKWPNDIYVHNRKICGILIENNLVGNKIQSSIVGIGININQTEFGELRATSLALENGRMYDIEDLLRQWCSCMDARYAQLRAGRYNDLKATYLQRMWGLHHKVEFYKNGFMQQGIIRGVNTLGQLMMQEAEGEFLYNFKEIEFVF